MNTSLILTDTNKTFTSEWGLVIRDILKVEPALAFSIWE